MDFDYSLRTKELCEKLSAFMDAHVAPRDAEWRKIAHAGAFPSEVVEPLKQRAREAGLWNLFLPSLRDDQPGTRLSNLEYAPLAEITGRVPWSPEVLNCNSPEGHCEIDFDVRVPAENLLGQEGDGFAIAQERLGPGRIHHCMRTIGQCELALELMVARAKSRRAFGSALADFANDQDWIAELRVEIDQARRLVLRAAWLMDKQGNKAARVDVSAIKIVAARLRTRVLDRAIQVFGAAGLTEDTPLAYLSTWGHALRFIDGPRRGPSPHGREGRDEEDQRRAARALIATNRRRKTRPPGGYRPMITAYVAGYVRTPIHLRQEGRAPRRKASQLLKRGKAGNGLATQCIGGGMGIAMIFEGLDQREDGTNP